MNEYGQVLLGIKDNKQVWVSCSLLYQKGEREIKEQLGMIERFPVKTDLSGNIMMVEGVSHDDAVNRYLNRAM